MNPAGYSFSIISDVICHIIIEIQFILSQLLYANTMSTTSEKTPAQHMYVYMIILFQKLLIILEH